MSTSAASIVISSFVRTITNSIFLVLATKCDPLWALHPHHLYGQGGPRVPAEVANPEMSDRVPDPQIRSPPDQCFAPFAETMPHASIMASGLVKAVKGFSRELCRKMPNMFVWLTRIVQWINVDEIGVNFVDFKRYVRVLMKTMNFAIKCSNFFVKSIY